MTYQQKIIKKCFSFSKKSKIICAIEKLLLFMLLGLITTLAMSCWFYYLSTKPVDPYLIPILKQFVIIFTFFGALFGFIAGFIYHESTFFWRFFKPDEESIKKYIQNEEKRIRETISSNKAYIQKLESNTDIEVAEIEQANSNLEAELQEVQSISYLQAVLLN